MESTLGFSHFLAQADAVAKTILLIMLVMSVTTWYLIFTKSIRNLFTSQKSRAFLKMFWEAPNVSVVAAHLQEQEKRGDPLQEPRRGVCPADYPGRQSDERRGVFSATDQGKAGGCGGRTQRAGAMIKCRSFPDG